jgi:hypothetical protein
MKNLIKSSLILFCVGLIGCNKNTQVEDNNGTKNYQNTVKESVLYEGKSNYSKIFRTDAPIMGYSTIKQNSLAEEEFKTVDDNVKSVSNGQQKVTSNTSMELRVNGKSLNELQKVMSGQSQRIKAVDNSLYGSNVNFTLSRRSLVKGSQKIVAKDTTISMYIPNLVEITSPRIARTEDLFPHCYYKDFMLKWNADPKNENGLVVIVEWNGTVLNGTSSTNYVRNIDIIPNDNGETVLNNKLFDNIPENALTYITLLRGNISILDDQISNRNRIVAESHAVLPFVLVRQL